MIAIDTNLLVRLLVADNPMHVALVRRLLVDETVYISRTVLLETDWVLRSRYRKTRAELLEFFADLLDIDNVVLEGAESVNQAVDWYALGADFADALHLAACGCAVMHTFDRAFCKAAREAGVAPAVRVWEV